MLAAGSSALAQQTTLPTGGIEAPLPDASAIVRDSAGRTIATAEFRQQARTDVVIRMVLADPPRLTGSHAVQIHAAASCASSDFSTAGALWNPTKKQHGLSNIKGPALGDLPNLNYSIGLTTYTAAIHGAVFAPGGLNSLVGGTGTSIVIFQNPDDGMTQPEGNAGARIACGAITATPPGGTSALAQLTASATPFGQVGAAAASSNINIFPTPTARPTTALAGAAAAAVVPRATASVTATATPLLRTTVTATATPLRINTPTARPTNTVVAAPAVRPAGAAPAVVQPAPAVGQAGQPAVGQPRVGQPVVAQPVAGQPAAAPPVAGQAVAGQPVAGQPIAQPAVPQNLAALAVPTPTVSALVAAPITTTVATNTSSNPPPILFIIGGIVAIGVGYVLAGLRRPRRA